MQSIRSLLILLIAVPALAAPPAPAPSNRQPTMADLQAMYDAGDYRACVQHIARVSGTAGFEKHALALLRAECLMGLKDKHEADRWYRIAADSPDAAIASAGRAGSLLVHAVGDGESYNPRQQRVVEPYPIATPEGRKKGMAALAVDMLAENRPKAEAAGRAKTLAPIIELAPKLIDIASLELASSGKTETVGPVLTTLREHALGIVGSALDGEERAVAAIAEKADQQIQTIVGPYWWQQTTGRRGLYSDDRAALRRVLAYTQQIQEFCEKGRHAAKDLNRDPSPWERSIERARSVQAKAQATLDRE